MLLLGGVAGGYEYVTGVEDIAASAGCWAAVPDLPAGRAYGGAALYEGQAMFCGGFWGGERHGECWGRRGGGRWSPWSSGGTFSP